MRFAFDIAAGSVPGRAHQKRARNNQDAFYWDADDNGVVAVVCDGCSAGSHSECGAHVGSRLVVRAILQALQERGVVASAVWTGLERAVEALRTLGLQLAPAHAQPETVSDFFLFTVVGVVVAGGGADAVVVPFAVGDGVVVVNGVRHVFGPFANNAPPYLGYALLANGAPATLHVDIHAPVPLTHVHSVVLGTDGALDVDVDWAAWCDDARVFQNPDMVRRRLTLLQRAQPMDDDTTVVLLKKKERAA